MSHTTPVAVLVDSLAALAAAAQDCTAEFVDNAGWFRAYQKTVCVHKLRHRERSDAYEIGLVPGRLNEAGRAVEDPAGPGWVLLYDNWAGGRGMMDAVGPECGRLMARYAYHRQLEELRSGGYHWTESVEADGTIELRVQVAEEESYAAQY